MKKTLVIDTETCSSDLLWDLPPEQMFRIGGYVWDNQDDVHITPCVEEFREVVRSAKYVVGHNIHRFDMTVIFGKDSTEPLEMAHQGRILDSWTHAELVDPAPEFVFTNRHGVTMKCEKPGEKRRWFGLDEMAHRLGVPGKSHDLKELDKEFGGFDKIPLDDPRYLQYLWDDVLAARHVFRGLLKKGPLDSYAAREQRIAAVCAQIMRTGWKVDKDLANSMVEANRKEREEYLVQLQEVGLPTDSKAPWSTKVGKQVIMEYLKSNFGVGVADLAKTKKGQPSLGKDSVKAAVKGRGEVAEKFGQVLAALSGERNLPEQALHHTKSDGRVHPDVETLQLSGRCSTTDPGLTTWTSRGPGAVNKKIFVPNEDDHVHVSFDFSNADARIVAAYSGDPEYAKRFVGDADGHMINAEIFWGHDVVHESKQTEKYYRNLGKPIGHAWAYGAQAPTISKTTGVDLETCKKAVENLNQVYWPLIRWQRKAANDARNLGYVMNDWGRKMPVNPKRAATQAPALLGQSGTRELMWDGVLKLPLWLQACIVCQVHDELMFSVPRYRLGEAQTLLKQCMEVSWKPRAGGQLIEFPVGLGGPADNWMDTTHD